MTKASIYRRSRSNNPAVAFPALVSLRQALELSPTTDSGFTQYGAGRLFLPAATNYCTNPSFETDTNGDGLADGWLITGLWSGIAGTPTFTRVPGRTGGYAQRIRYTGAGGDSNATLDFGHRTADASVASGDVLTLSLHIKGSVSGLASNTLRWGFYDAADAFLSGTGSSLVGAFTDSSYTRIAPTVTAPANTDHIRLWVRWGGVDTGDTFDITIDDVLIEKSAVLTPYGDGSYSGWSWSGAANASTSVRAASDLRFALGSVYGVNGVGTMAARIASLETNFGSIQRMLIGAYDADVAKMQSYLQVPSGGARLGAAEYDGVHYPNVYTASTASAIGSVHSLIGRHDGTHLNLMYDGTASAEVDDTATITGLDVLCIGGLGGREADTFFCGHIGPAVISSACITDAQTATLSAMLTAGATGLDLFRWAQREGLSGSLILPLGSDSRGYVVV